MGMSFFFIIGGIVLIVNHQIKTAQNRKQSKIDEFKEDVID